MPASQFFFEIDDRPRLAIIRRAGQAYHRLTGPIHNVTLMSRAASWLLAILVKAVCGRPRFTVRCQTVRVRNTYDRETGGGGSQSHVGRVWIPCHTRGKENMMPDFRDRICEIAVRAAACHKDNERAAQARIDEESQLPTTKNG